MTAPCRLCNADTDANVCGRCLHRVERVLGDLPGLAADLEATVTRQTAGSGLVRRRSSDRPLPYADGPAITTARQAVDGLAEWAEHVAGERPTGDLLQRAMMSAVLLAGSLEWFAVDDRGPDAAEALLRIRAALRRAVDRHASRVYAGPCDAEIVEIVTDYDPAAGTLTPRLETRTCDGDVCAEPGDPLALCGTCRVHHPIAERRAFLLAALEDELLPLGEILAALPVLTGRHPSLDAVRQWRHRRRLTPAGVDAAGRDLYRAGDVIRLARTYRPRPTAEGIPA